MKKNALKQPILNTIKELNEKGVKNIKVNGLYHIVNDEGVHDSLYRTENFTSTLQTLFNVQELNQNLSKKTIIIKLIDIINELLQTKEPSREINKMLANLETEILTKKEYKVYIPIKGVAMSTSKLNIGKKTQILELNKEQMESLIPTSHFTEITPFTIEYIINIPDYFKAIEIGVEASKMIVHFLRLVDYFFWDEESLGLRLPGFGVIREDLTGIAVTRIENDKLESYSWKLIEANEDTLMIDKHFINDSEHVGLSKFGNLIDKFIDGTLFEFEKTILRSIVLFGESKVEHDLSSRFLKLTLVLECFLNTSPSEPVTFTLSERAAFIYRN